MRFKNALKRFAYETFRPHSKDEYAELFSRGHGGTERTPYPWFYARVFLISLLLFSLLCVGYGASELNFLMVTAAGGFFADITFIILLVEIYPKRDLPLLTPVLALFAGGVLSSAFIYVMYGIANFDAPFADQAWTAFVEETGKALTTVIILLFIKKRNPFACFIIGAAVGGGYSAFENMWFMYTYGFGWQGLSQAIETGLWRALGTPFSHAAWAGIFGWAIAGKKPWRSWKPYVAYAFNYTMHFFVNFPLMPQFAEWKGYPISAVTGILSITIIIFIIIRCRRDLTGFSAQTSIFEYVDMRGYPKINGEYAVGNVQMQSNIGYGEQRYKFLANVFAAAAIFCFSFTLLGPTCVFGGYVNYRTYYYDNWQDVLSLLQNGRTIQPDYEREYDVGFDDLSENYSYTWTDGELISVVQREKYGDYYFRFTYGYTTYGYTTYYDTEEDADGNFYVIVNGNKVPVESEDGNAPLSARIWELKSVALELNGNVYYPRTIANYSSDIYPTYSSDGTTDVYRYFLLNSSVSYIYAHTDGTFEVDLRDKVAVRGTEAIIFSAIFFAAFASCGVAFIVYNVKARRNKDAE